MTGCPWKTNYTASSRWETSSSRNVPHLANSKTWPTLTTAKPEMEAQSVRYLFFKRVAFLTKEYVLLVGQKTPKN